MDQELELLFSIREERGAMRLLALIRRKKGSFISPCIAIDVRTDEVIHEAAQSNISIDEARELYTTWRDKHPDPLALAAEASEIMTFTSIFAPSANRQVAKNWVLVTRVGAGPVRDLALDLLSKDRNLNGDDAIVIAQDVLAKTPKGTR